MAAKSIPDGYYSATPYLVLENAAKAIEFYKQAFGAAVEDSSAWLRRRENRPRRDQDPDSPIMLADEFPEMGYPRPAGSGGSPVSIMFAWKTSMPVLSREAGAKAIRPVKDEFYGDRAGTIEDPFGHKWTIAPQGRCFARRSKSAMQR